MIYTVSIKNDSNGRPVVVVYGRRPRVPIREDWVASICPAQGWGKPPKIAYPPEVWDPENIEKFRWR